MAKIDASVVKALRDRTGLGMMECKKALASAGGDMEQAIADLRKAGAVKAASRSAKVAAEGLVVVATAADNGIARGGLLEVNCETDFVARGDDFIAFANAGLEQAMAQWSATLDELRQSLEEQRVELVRKVGENIHLRRLHRVAAPVVGHYLHGQRIGVLVGQQGGDARLAAEVAMHIAAMDTRYVEPDQVPSQVRAQEQEIFLAQARASGKPPEVQEKMVAGRMRKFLAEISLVEQSYIRDPDRTVGSLLKEADAQVLEFIRFEVGAGLDAAAGDG